MVKRIIGILLSFCMTAVFVSGCGENAEKPGHGRQFRRKRPKKWLIF